MYPLSDWTESECAWMAGLLEGEAWFGLDRGPAIVLRMSDRDVVDRVAVLWGGRKVDCLKPGLLGKLDSHRVRIGGRKAQEVMRRIRPWLGERRAARVDELLAVSVLKQGGHA